MLKTVSGLRLAECVVPCPQNFPEGANRSGSIVAGRRWRENLRLMKSEVFQRLGSIPAIVHIVLTEATRRRAAREITDAVFENQIQRITREELTPKGLKLLMREMPGGRTRFIIKKQATGVVFDLLNFDADGALEPDSAMLLEPEASPA